MLWGSGSKGVWANASSVKRAQGRNKMESQASHFSCKSSSKPASKHSFLDKCPRGWKHHNFSVCLALHNFKPLVGAGGMPKGMLMHPLWVHMVSNCFL